MTALVCAHCGKVRQGNETQPKQLAKKLHWIHGNGKGTWICLVCQKLMRRNQNEVRDVNELQ
jgi:hypothetical protein